MALARVASQKSADGSLTGAAGHISINANTTGADFIAAWCSVNATGDTTFTATYNSVSMGTGTKDNTAGQLQVVFVQKSPSQGSSLSLDVSTGLNNFPATLIGVSYSGTDSTTPNGTIDAQGSSTGTTGASGSITQSSGNWIVSGLATSGGTGPTIASGLHGNTTVAVVGNSGSNNSAAYGEDTDGSTDTFNWSWTGAQPWSVLSFSLNAAAGGGAASPGVLLIPPNLHGYAGQWISGYMQ